MTTAGNTSNTVMTIFGATFGLRAANSTTVLASARPNWWEPEATRVTDSPEPAEPSLTTSRPRSRKMPFSAAKNIGALPP